MTELHPDIPRVLCPCCGDIMRLGRVGPRWDDTEVMQFNCECGFDYEMSARAKSEAKESIDSEVDRRPSLYRLVSAGVVPNALALDDGAAAHFVGRRLLRIVSARPAARGYAVRRRRSQCIETALPIVRISDK